MISLSDRSKVFRFSRAALCHLCGWIERIPGGTRQHDGVETGSWGPTAARIVWLRVCLWAGLSARPRRWVRARELAHSLPLPPRALLLRSSSRARPENPMAMAILTTQASSARASSRTSSSTWARISRASGLPAARWTRPRSPPSSSTPSSSERQRHAAP